jgi:iron-sulfur cluster assembly accessory protein
MDLSVTPAAARFIRRMIRMGGAEGGGLRLEVKPGGCSGLTAEFTVESAARPGDGVVEREGFALFLPVESRLLLQGVTIDFADTATETGLVFHDPKASCGCSSSESAAAPQIVSLG